jgi:membrane protein implicated in regulation of membrane protease activity
MMRNFISHTPWLWLTSGIILCAAETLAPGISLLWIGLAAIATGVIAFSVELSAEGALIVFALLSIALALVGRKLYGPVGAGIVESMPGPRAASLIGREFILDQPISQGFGQIRVDDTVWRVRGADQPSGAKVRVKQVEDEILLVVEKA